MGSRQWAAGIQAHVHQRSSCSSGPAPSGDELSPLCLTLGEAIGFLATAWGSLYGCLRGSRFSVGLGYVNARAVPQMSLEKWG